MISKGWPDVSIVIPARNAAGTIGRTLEAALAQDYGGNIEIVVGDGSDDDGTKAMCQTFPNVKVVSNPRRITSSGLNQAIRASSGEIIVRCDAQAVLPPEYVRLIVTTLRLILVACAGGVQVPVGDNAFGKAVAIAMASPLGSGDSKYKTRRGNECLVDTVYLGAFRKKTWEEVGGFDETLVHNQDYEFNWRIRQAGGYVWLNRSLKVGYLPRNNLWALTKQYFNYGRWKASMLRQHPKSLRLRQLAPPALFLGLLASLGVSAGDWWWGSILPGLYLSLILGATARYLAGRKAITTPIPLRVVLLLPLVYMTMHLSWGVGFFTPVRRDKI